MTGRRHETEHGASLTELVAEYNDAWNRQDLDEICAAHAPGMVFENHSAGERAEGDEVRAHIASIFRNWPDLRFEGRSIYAGADFVVQEWTATATHPSGRTISWEGLDVFPFAGGKILRKDVYSNASRRIAEQLAHTVEGGSSMDGYTIVHRDELARDGGWALCRRSLGLSSFGMGLVEIPRGSSIPEHDETGRDQEEVFLVLSGSPTMVIDGQDHPAPEGTFVRLDPALRRTIVNRGDEHASVLIVSAPRSSGYEPMDWN